MVVNRSISEKKKRNVEQVKTSLNFKAEMSLIKKKHFDVCDDNISSSKNSVPVIKNVLPEPLM